MPKETIIRPTKHADKKTEGQAKQFAWLEIQCCDDDGFDMPGGEWIPVAPVDVPEWARAEDVMGMMVKGESCRNDAQGGGRWYRAVHCSPTPPVLDVVH